MKLLIRTYENLICFLFACLLPLNVYSQSCDLYFPLVKGAQYELETYSPKQKKTGRILYVVKETSQQGNKTEAQMLNQMYDNKDKLASESNYSLICDNNQIKIDMRAYMHPETIAAYQDMDIKMEGDHLSIPSSLQAGQSLPEGNMTMLVSDKESGNMMSTIKVRIYNRTVEGKENITSPAGSFDCYKINYEMRIETITMGLPIPLNLKGSEWLSSGIGMVKSETFRNNGKSVGYTLLAKTKK